MKEYNEKSSLKRPDIEDVLLIVIYYACGPLVLNRRLIQQLVYEVSQKVDLGSFAGCYPKFRKYSVGPHSEPIANAIGELIAWSFLVEEPTGRVVMLPVIKTYVERTLLDKYTETVSLIKKAVKEIIPKWLEEKKEL